VVQAAYTKTTAAKTARITISAGGGQAPPVPGNKYRSPAMAW
jgi:hypothetical protein